MYLVYFMTPHPVETLHWKPEMSILMVMLEEKSGPITKVIRIHAFLYQMFI